MENYNSSNYVSFQRNNNPVFLQHEHNQESYYVMELQHQQFLPPEPAQVSQPENFPANFGRSLLARLPPGYRFCPTGTELVECYLRRKMIDKSLLPFEHEKIILDAEVYNHHPQELIEMHQFEMAKEEEEWYFFTFTERKYENGSRPRRDAGDGFWKPTGKDEEILRGGGRVAVKKVLDYYEGKHGKGVKTHWKMYEYRFKQEADNRPISEDPTKLDKCVLCKIFKNKRGTAGKISKNERGTKRKRDEQEADSQADENTTSSNPNQLESGSSSALEPEFDASVDNNQAGFNNESYYIPQFTSMVMNSNGEMVQIPNSQVLRSGESWMMTQNQQVWGSLTGPAADNYFMSLPAGFKFKPTAEELILHYLQKKLFNLPLPTNRIREVDLYKYHPFLLSEMYTLIREDKWYFFTPRDKKYLNGKRPNRSTGNKSGYWKASGADDKIWMNGVVIGRKKTLVYYDGSAAKNDGIKSNWIMHEYRIDPMDSPNNNSSSSSSTENSSNPMLLDKWVLCSIHYRTENPKNKTEESILQNQNMDLETMVFGDQNPLPAAPPYIQQHPTSIPSFPPTFAPTSYEDLFNEFLDFSYPTAPVGGPMDFSSGPGGPSGQSGYMDAAPQLYPTAPVVGPLGLSSGPGEPSRQSGYMDAAPQLYPTALVVDPMDFSSGPGWPSGESGYMDALSQLNGVLDIGPITDRQPNTFGDGTF